MSLWFHGLKAKLNVGKLTPLCNWRGDSFDFCSPFCDEKMTQQVMGFFSNLELGKIQACEPHESRPEISCQLPGTHSEGNCSIVMPNCNNAKLKN